jgi:RNA polymerase sigma-70 factor (ECF subfamily)
MNDTEHEIACWASLKNGDPGALEYFYDHYADRLFTVAARMTDDRELAKDALQDVFIELWNYRNGIGEVRHTEAYLIRMMRNTLIKKLKEEGRRIHQSVESLVLEENNREEVITSRETEMEMCHRLERALGRLTGRQREILHLHYHQGLSYSRIAEELHMNYQSVNNLAFRTMRNLRHGFFFLLIVGLAVAGWFA